MYISIQIGMYAHMVSAENNQLQYLINKLR